MAVLQRLHYALQKFTVLKNGMMFECEIVERMRRCIYINTLMTMNELTKLRNVAGIQSE